MKFAPVLALSACAFFSLSSIAADTYENVVCGSASGYLNRAGSTRGSTDVLSDAANSLRQTLSTIPDTGSAKYSKAFEAYIEVTKKTVLRVDLNSHTAQMTAHSCVPGGVDDWQWDKVQCNQATACSPITIIYSECTHVVEDRQNGTRTITCPSGRKIRESI